MDDVDAILDYAHEVLEQVRTVHAETLDLDEPSPKLKVRIKSVLENQRSALDYLAFAITERFGTAGFHTYYPLAQASTEFADLVDEKMPGVAVVRPDIRDAIERHQPYREPWLRELNRLTRENKHRRLTRQEKMYLPRLVQTNRRGGSQVYTPYRAWLFAELGRPVVETLEQFQRGATGIIQEVSHVAGL